MMARHFSTKPINYIDPDGYFRIRQREHSRSKKLFEKARNLYANRVTIQERGYSNIITKTSKDLGDVAISLKIGEMNHNAGIAYAVLSVVDDNLFDGFLTKMTFRGFAIMGSGGLYVTGSVVYAAENQYYNYRDTGYAVAEASSWVVETTNRYAREQSQWPSRMVQ